MWGIFCKRGKNLSKFLGVFLTCRNKKLAVFSHFLGIELFRINSLQVN